MNYHVKLKMFALLAVFLFCNALNSAAQEKGITINVKNASLKEVFSVIEKQTSYRFSYRNVVIDSLKDITISKTNAAVSTVLDEVFAKRNLSYNIVSAKSIVVSDKQIPETKEKEFSRRYSGTVTDEAGEPIIGASVAEKGTTNGTVTGINGNFSLNISENAVLQVSFIGYHSREIAVGAQTNLEITLREDVLALNEVVVVGYGTQKKTHLSGAVSSISSKALENRPVNNANLALQGLAPNVNIRSTSGNPMAAPEINVRGYSAIGYGYGALILVDNVPMSATEFSRMNPADIENVSVLKDAASAAIYGARAAYGVVLVTTKTAKSQKLEISADLNYGVRKELHKFEYDYDLPTMMWTINQASGDPEFNDLQMDYARQRMANRSLPEIRFPVGNPFYDSNYPTLDNENRYDYYAMTDWHDVVTRKLPGSMNANFSIGQRTERMNFITSAAYYQAEGIYLGENPSKRYNIRAGGNYKLFNWWSVGAMLTFSRMQFDEPYEIGRSGSLGNVNISSLYIKNPPKNPDGTWTESGANSLGRLTDGGRSLSVNNQTQFSFNTQLDVVKDVFVIKGDANIRLSNANSDAWNLPTKRTKNGISFDSTGGTALVSSGSSNGIFTTFNLYGDFHKTFGDKHFVQALAGFNQEYTSNSSTNVSQEGLINDNFPTLALTTGRLDRSQNKNALSLRGAFGRLNYTFDDRYIVEFNGRYDGTSRYAQGHRFGFFPSVTGAWIASNEKFFEPVKDLLKISFLKFRGSYGSLGNQVSGDYYPYFSMMPNPSPIGLYIDGNRPLSITSPNGDKASNLTWTTVRTVNFGANLGLFDNRFIVEFDRYTRYTEGMVAGIKPMPAQYGAEPPMTNSADLKTKGWELDLTWRDEIKNVAGSPLTYSFRFMLSDARAWITKYDNPTGAIGIGNGKDWWRAGMEFGELWGFEIPGLFQSDEEAKNWHDQSAVKQGSKQEWAAGDLKFNDLDGNGKIDRGSNTESDPGDRRIIGNSQIRLPYSFDFGAAWKDFDFRIFFQGVGKRDWYPEFDYGGDEDFWSNYRGSWRTPSIYIRDHWTPENPNGYYPRQFLKFAHAGSDREWGLINTRYLQDASYLRLKNLTIGYTLPKGVTSKWGISRLRVYFSGENLWTKSHIRVDAIDPEVIGYSNDGGNHTTMYPMQKIYSMGLSLNF